MTLQPNFLPVGSVVYQVIENFEPCTPKPIVFSESNWYRIGECVEYLDWFQPIQLTPEILTEWCNMKLERKQLSLNIGGELMDYATDGKMCIYYSKKGWTLDSIVNKDTVYFQYLHELQLLFLGMKQVLPITIK